jgi:hypothetical protein
MRVLRANLKVFYRCRSVWAGCSLFVFLSWLNWFFLRLPTKADHTGHNIVLLELIFGVLAIGAAIGVMQLAIAMHPLSFCLPGHRTAVRSFVFLMGTIVGLASSSLFVFLIARASIPLGRSALAFSSMFCASLALFLMGAACPFHKTGLVTGILLALPLVMVFAFAGPVAGLFPPLPVVIEHILIHCGGLVIASGSLFAAGAWVWLGREPWFLRTGGDWWRQGLFRRRVPSTATDQASPLASIEGPMGRAILRAMARCEYANVPRYLWGALYAWLLPGGGGRASLILTGLLSVGSGALAWYMPSMGPFLIANACISSAFGTWTLPTAMNSPLLVTGGRRERFFTSVTLTIVLGVIVTCGAVLAVVTMKWLGVPTLLQATNPEGSRSYWEAVATQPTNLRLAFLLTALFPISSLLGMRLRGRKFWASIAQEGVVLLVFIPALFTRPLLLATSPSCVALVFILSWIVCIYGVHRIAMRSDLGRK